MNINLEIVPKTYRTLTCQGKTSPINWEKLFYNIPYSKQIS